jgi:hypothetical protein
MKRAGPTRLAIVRVDDLFEVPPSVDTVHGRVTSKEVVATQQIAEAEVERLDELAGTAWAGREVLRSVHASRTNRAVTDPSCGWTTRSGPGAGSRAIAN